VIKISRITEIAEVLKCLPFEREIRKKGRDDTRESKMLLFIESQIANPCFGFWMAYDEGQIKGYSSAILSFVPGVERAHLLRIYAKSREVRDLLEKTMIDWAKSYNMKIVQMTVINNVKALQRRYGFLPVSVNMERRL